jgi:hypothetical protein
LTLSTYYASKYVNFGFVCLNVHLQVQIAPSNLGFESIFPAQCWLKQVVPSITDMSALNWL